jgi:hypothetical protein
MSKMLDSYWLVYSYFSAPDNRQEMRLEDLRTEHANMCIHMYMEWGGGWGCRGSLPTVITYWYVCIFTSLLRMVG